MPGTVHQLIHGQNAVGYRFQFICDLLVYHILQQIVCSEIGPGSHFTTEQISKAKNS